MTAITQFWRWWTDGLSAPLPSLFRKSLGDNKSTVWAVPDASGFRFMSRRGKGWKLLVDTLDGTGIPDRVRKRLSANRVILRIPQDQAIVRSYSLTRGADAEHEARSRLEEVSPLPASQQYFDSVCDDSGTMTLAIVRKSWVDGKIEELGELGIGIGQATVEELEDTRINLLPGNDEDTSRADIPGLVMLFAGALVCGLGYQLTTQQQHEVLSAIESQQQGLQNRLQSGQPVRDQIDLLQSRVSDMAARLSASPPPLSVMADVTRATPDHTWVRNWILDGSKLTLLGETTDTADLISGLEASPLLSEVQYQSAITRDPANNRERYRISAVVPPR